MTMTANIRHMPATGMPATGVPATGMPATTSRGVRLAATAALASWGPSVWAQAAGSCEISLGYAPAITAPLGVATAVPGLGMLAVAALAALVAGLAWRHRHQGGMHRMMAVVGMAGALGLSALGGGSLVEAVRAAGPYEFSNAAGGTVADSGVAYADPAPVLTVTNTSGVRIRITANGNATETGSCALNQELAPGASCTTQAYACTPPAQPLLVINSTAAPAIGCTFIPALNTYAYNSTNPGAGVFYAHAPLMAAEPTFDVPGVTTSFSYTRNATDAIYGAGNSLSNETDLKTGVGTFTSTAPAGYVFAPGNTSTMSWTLPYNCWTAPAQET